MNPKRNCKIETTKLGGNRYLQHCVRCGSANDTKTTTEQFSRTCSVQGWGWRLAQWMRKFGITEERYAAARGRKRICGGMNCYIVELQPNEPSCMCGSRQAWLDWADDWARSKVNQLWPTRPPTPR